jgi:hypothetical protein
MYNVECVCTYKLSFANCLILDLACPKVQLNDYLLRRSHTGEHRDLTSKLNLHPSHVKLFVEGTDTRCHQAHLDQRPTLLVFLGATDCRNVDSPLNRVPPLELPPHVLSCSIFSEVASLVPAFVVVTFVQIIRMQ